LKSFFHVARRIPVLPIGEGNVKYLQIMFWSKHLSTLNNLIGMYRFVLRKKDTLVSLQTHEYIFRLTSIEPKALDLSLSVVLRIRREGTTSPIRHSLVCNNKCSLKWLVFLIILSINQSELRTYIKVVPFKEKFLSFCSIVKNIEWNGIIKIDDWS
jgi:hypothetical protein